MTDCKWLESFYDVNLDVTNVFMNMSNLPLKVSHD